MSNADEKLVLETKIKNIDQQIVLSQKESHGRQICPLGPVWRHFNFKDIAAREKLQPNCSTAGSGV
jgi:hypothetical protein